MEKIQFDDIDALMKKAGGDYGPWSEELEVTQQMINDYADLSGDHQWIHVDVERCKKESPFGGPIAHGFLTLSLLPGMRGKPEWVMVGFKNAVNYGSDKLRFLSPVPAGAKIHSRSRLVDAKGTPKGTRAVTEIAVHVVGSDRPALLYEMIVLYQ